MLSFCSSPLRKARALYACKAEHDSELSFTAGTVFDNGECPLRPRGAGPGGSGAGVPGGRLPELGTEQGKGTAGGQRGNWGVGDMP